MMKHIKTIAFALALIVAAIALWRSFALEEEIKSLKTSLSNSINNVQGNIDSIYINVDAKLKEQASLFSDTSYEYGEADFNAGTVQVKITVKPKEYTASTVAEALYNGKSFPLTQVGGSFTGIAEIPLYENTEAEIGIKLTDGENIRTETPDWHFSPAYEFHGSIGISEHSLDAHAKYDKDKYSVPVSGALEISYYKGKSGNLKELWLVHEIDGKEIERISIPLNAPVPPGYGIAAPIDNPENQSVTYFELIKNFEAPYGSLQAVYIEAVEDTGYRYQEPIGIGTLTLKVKAEEQGVYYFDEEFYPSKIIDKNGKTLWESDK